MQRQSLSKYTHWRVIVQTQSTEASSVLIDARRPRPYRSRCCSLVAITASIDKLIAHACQRLLVAPTVVAFSRDVSATSLARRSTEPWLWRMWRLWRSSEAW